MTTANPTADSKAPDPNVVHKSITVPLAIEQAFQLWTEGISTWWPAGHSRSGEADIAIFIEGEVGGRLYERTKSGTEHEWGSILVWEPPAHLAYHWYLGSGPTQPTRVDVTFSVISQKETLVQIEHRGPELIGELWWLNNQRYRAAWDIVLPAYERNASKQA